MREMMDRQTEVYENKTLNNVYVLDHELREAEVYRNGSPYPTEHVELDGPNWDALVSHLRKTATLTW